ncbi:hypothetical protein L1987_25158 [Smallanthus sonchifolius]|uniref:Uncharacterized protein n=1 Tax=Smallanthus sonchifolius TaxID=185202 RepID=A0ACB9IND7_9ASTR|nr:hypothetical protein L1987_25158 [Smallanthus sonchifolius]
MWSSRHSPINVVISAFRLESMPLQVTERESEELWWQSSITYLNSLVTKYDLNNPSWDFDDNKNNFQNQTDIDFQNQTDTDFQNQIGTDLPKDYVPTFFTGDPNMIQEIGNDVNSLLATQNKYHGQYECFIGKAENSYRIIIEKQNLYLSKFESSAPLTRRRKKRLRKLGPALKSPFESPRFHTKKEDGVDSEFLNTLKQIC